MKYTSIILKKVNIILTGTIMIIVLASAYYLSARFSNAEQLPFFPINVENDTTLTIGIIGDSWVSEGKLDSLLKNNLREKGFKKILSSGHPGAISKRIYMNLFEESTNKYSSKFIIENNPDYCIVIAGVNDAVGQYGAKFYSHHITEIIKTLLHYNIKPVIVQLPEFGIIQATDKLSFIEKERNKLFAKFTNSGELYNIEAYREELSKTLISEMLYDKIILINFERICKNYSGCESLFENPSHLSNSGNIKLCNTIAEELLKNTNVSMIDI